MMFNTTFNNISVLLWQSVLLMMKIPEKIMCPIKIDPTILHEKTKTQIKGQFLTEKHVDPSSTTIDLPKKEGDIIILNYIFLWYKME